MSDLCISLVQAPLVWHDIPQNLAYFAEKIAPLARRTDVIVLPEMFSTGFTMQPNSVAESLNGQTMAWLEAQAAATNAVLTTSFVQRTEAGSFRNTLVWMPPDGNYTLYHKRHLFRMAGEHEVYEKGNEKQVVVWRGWRICPMICYDLRFPVWARNGYNGEQLDYDLLIYTANWPQPRSLAWRTLLPARAIENLCYVAGVNRIGQDQNGYVYQGDSLVADFQGTILFHAENRETIETTTLSHDALAQYRAKCPFYLDADAFEIEQD